MFTYLLTCPRERGEYSRTGSLFNIVNRFSLYTRIYEYLVVCRRTRQAGWSWGEVWGRLVGWVCWAEGSGGGGGVGGGGG